MAKINRHWPWPSNVTVRGTYAEDVKSQQKLEKDIEASPLAKAEPGKFLAPKGSSDHLRMGHPHLVADDGRDRAVGRFPIHQHDIDSFRLDRSSHLARWPSESCRLSSMTKSLMQLALPKMLSRLRSGDCFKT